MSLHIAPTTGCNLGCGYCYENPDRERKQEWVDRQYDIDKIMDRLEEWKDEHAPDGPVPGLHGGEPLLVRNEHLDRIFSYIYEHWDGNTAIQTNGTLIDDEIVEMFEEYDVHVGISCDGPGDLNRQRKAANERDADDTNTTDKKTEATIEGIEKVVESDTSVGIITVLSETNVDTDENLEQLLDWMDWLNENGVSGHFNPAIPYDDVQQDVSLDPERIKEVYLRTWEWMKAEPYRQWNPMRDYVDNLTGVALGNCVNDKCDVFNAGAAKIINGEGETTGCGKTWSQVGDGVPFLQGKSSGNEWDSDEERYEMLKQTPGAPDRPDEEPDFGGCKGCEYWNVCQGGCPSAGIDDDYRNRTVWCKAKYALYERIEQDIRAIFPNVTLITDFPWDAPLAEKSTKWQLDIRPFAAMDPQYGGKTSTYGSYETPHDESYENILGEPETFDEKVQKMKMEHGEENVTSNKETHQIHADSDDPDNVSGWEEV